MTSPLSKQDGIDDLKRALEAKRAELLSRAAEEITIERAADSMDELVLANERDLAVDTLNRKAQLLRQVSDALGRIASGSYGICVECDEMISSKRLAALPWAARCLQCQEIADREARTKTVERMNPSELRAA